MKVKSLFKYIMLFVFYYIICRAYMISPKVNVFGFGPLFVSIMNGAGFVSIAVYIVAYVLASFTIESLYTAILTFAVAIVLIIAKKQRKIKKFVYYLCVFASQSVILFINIQTPKVLLIHLFGLIAGVLFAVVCDALVCIVKNRKGNFKLNTDELIAVGVALIVFGCGLNSCVYYLNPLRIVAVFLILTLSHYFGSSFTLGAAAMFGLSSLVNTPSVYMLSSFVIYSVFALAFRSNIKVLSIIAVVLSDIAFSFYVVGAFDVWSLIDILIASGAYLIVKTKWVDKIKHTFAVQNTCYISRGIVNQSRDEVSIRLRSVAAVFNQMSETYKNLVKKEVSPQQSKQIILNELVGKVCAHCPNRTKCTRIDGKFMTEVFDDILNVGLQRGKVTLLDIPPYFTGKCMNVSVVVNTLNALIKNCSEYNALIKSNNDSKLLIADNLTGVSAVLEGLSNEVSKNVSFDNTQENRIKEELTYKNIIALEVAVCTADSVNSSITIVVAEDFASYDVLEKCVSSVCGSQYGVISKQVAGGVQVLTLKPTPRYDVVFGVSSVGKDGNLNNGDSHSVVKLNEGKLLIGMSDGMGTGYSAHSTSSLAMSLIENFYKAGFDSDIILACVNKLLTLSNDENYSTMDLCVINLFNATCDFVKLGAPFGVIKKDNNVEMVDGSGLPIGILEEMKPCVNMKLLNNFDSVILFTDGVVDAFGDKDNLVNFVSNITTTNPQTMADEILDGACDMCKGILQDDMTVLVAKIYPM